MTSASNRSAPMINTIMRETPVGSILTYQRVTQKKRRVMNFWFRSGGTKSPRVCEMKAIYSLTLFLLGSSSSLKQRYRVFPDLAISFPNLESTFFLFSFCYLFSFKSLIHVDSTIKSKREC